MAVLDVDGHAAALLEASEQQFVGQAVAVVIAFVLVQIVGFDDPVPAPLEDDDDAEVAA